MIFTRIKKTATPVMLLMIVFQSFFSPIAAIAETNETKDEDKSSLELNQLKLTENEEDYAVVTVEMTTNNETENEQTHKLTTNLPVEIVDEVEKEGIATKVDEDDRKVEVTVAPDMKTKFDLKLKVKKENANEQTLVVINDKQDKKIVIPSVATEESSEETKKEDDTKESTSDTEEKETKDTKEKQEETEKTKEEDKQSTKESTTETEEKATKDTKEKQEETEKTKEEDKQDTKDKQSKKDKEKTKESTIETEEKATKDTKESTTDTEKKKTKDTKEKQKDTKKTKKAEGKQGTGGLAAKTTPLLDNVDPLLSLSLLWDDNNDQDGLRPNSLRMRLMGGPKVGEYTELDKTFKLTAADDWKTTLVGLPYTNIQRLWVMAENNLSGYAWDNNSPDKEWHYEKVGDGSFIKGKVVVVLKHTPSKTDVNVEKKWDDDQDKDELRPDSVKMSLKADGNSTGKTLTLKKSDDWKGSFDNLDEYKNGEKIKYSIEEEKVDGYDSEVTEEKDNNFVVTNHRASKPSLSGRIVWDDNNNQDGLRPNSFKMEVRGGPDSASSSRDLLRSFEVTAADDWKINLYNVPYTNWANVVAKNGTLPSGYEFDVSNSYIRYKQIGDKAEGDFVRTYKHIPSKTDVNVEKKWDDAQDQDGKRPDSVKMSLKADGKSTGKTVTLKKSDDWKGSFDNLDEYKNGEKIKYSVEEEEVDGYDSEITKEKDNNFVVTNHYEPSKTNVNVEKKWNDDQDKNGQRPDSVKVSLKADGKTTGKTVTLKKSDDWKGSFDNLDEYKNGEKINYTVQEENINGYSAKYNYTEGKTKKAVITNSQTRTSYKTRAIVDWEDNNNQDGIRPTSVKFGIYEGHVGDDKNELRKKFTLTKDDSWEDVISYSVFKGGGSYITDYPPEGYERVAIDHSVSSSDDYDFDYHIVYKHTPSKTNVNVEKKWDDDQDKDELRPDSVKMSLKADGKSTGKTLTLKKSDDWKGSFDNLDEYKNGKKIKYSVEEEEVDGYDSEVSQKNDNNFVVTNYHEPAREKPVDPTDPDKEPEPGTKGPLSLDYASVLDFGKQKISVDDETYYAKPQQWRDKDGNLDEERTSGNFAQVTDKRGGTKGWSLSVKQNGQFTSESEGKELTGAKITFKNGQATSEMNTPTPSLVKESFTLSPDGDGNAEIVMAASEGEGFGLWHYVLGNKETMDKSIELNVPGSTQKDADTYKTSLTWSLTDVPGNK